MRWEYQLDEGQLVGNNAFELNDLQAQLEKRGNEGWELVNIQLYKPEDGYQRILLTFKRPKPAKRVERKRINKST